MKIDLYKFSNDLLLKDRCLFVYGNMPDLADVLLEFFVSSLRQDFKVKHLTCADFLKTPETEQEDLFGSALNVYRISNVVDNNVNELIDAAALSSAIFVATPGDFRKSKTVTDVMTKSWMALPSFKNKISYNAICKYFFKGANQSDYDMISSILEKTSENLASVIFKLSLLYEADKSLIPSYTAEEDNWIYDMQSIAFLRFLASSGAKGSLDRFAESLFGKNADHKNELNLDKIFNYCLTKELHVKYGGELTNDMILNDLILDVAKQLK